MLFKSPSNSFNYLFTKKMKNNEFLKKLNACYKNEQKTIKKIEKTDKKDILLKLNLELLGYNTKCINML